MAEGYYRIAASTDDAQCNASTLDNSGTYLRWGNISGGDVYRTYLRFQLNDIPVGAIIDKAYLYVYQDAGSNNAVTGTTVELIDSDDQAAFTSAGTVWALTTTHSVAWSDVYGTDNTWRIKDIKDLVQAYIRRPGFVASANKYMGLRIRSDSEITTVFFQSVQMDFNNGTMRAHLFVAWHQDQLGQRMDFWEVGASTSDTGNSTDDSADNTADTYYQFGQTVQNNKNVSDCFNRVGMRWAPSTIPAGATIYNAQVVIAAYEADTATAVGRIGVLTAAQTAAFTSNEFANLIAWNATGATTWSSIESQPAAGALIASPNIATALQTRVQDGSYSPSGADPNNHVAVSLADNGDQSSATAHRSVCLYDHASFPAPILVARFSIPKLALCGCVPSTGSFMVY